MRLSLPALLIALLLAAAPAAARMLGDASVPFSADRSLTVGDRTFKGKLYSRPGDQRHEQAFEGIDQVIILHGEGAKGWLVLPKLNSYVEFGFAPAAADLGDTSLLSTKLGEETIEGLKTTKYRIEHTARDGTLIDGYLWLTKDGIAMRLDGMYTPANGGKPLAVRMALSHVQQGPQKAEIFALPPNMAKLPPAALVPLLGLGKTG
jgi:hypothetical protein